LSLVNLSVHVLPDGIDAETASLVVYDIDQNLAHLGPVTIAGPCVAWRVGESYGGPTLTAPIDLDPSRDWLVRCDRVDFPPGGVAYRHTHPGPGIRVLLHGGIRIESAGLTHDYGPFEPWFENGPEPVFAQASATSETAFVRAMLLPREWEGRRTISYVDVADAAKPKTQRATVFLEAPIEL